MTDVPRVPDIVKMTSLPAAPDVSADAHELGETIRPSGSDVLAMV